MSTDLVIARLDAARLALSEARTIQDTKKILDVAAAAEIYAKRQKLSDENIAFANEVKIEALRQLGEFLKEAPKNTGNLRRGSEMEPRGQAQTLADQGIDKKTSMTAQRLASLPVEKYEEVKSGKVSLAKATATPKPQSSTPAPEPTVNLGAGAQPEPAGVEPDTGGMTEQEFAEAQQEVAAEDAAIAKRVQVARDRLALILLDDEDPLNAVIAENNRLAQLLAVAESQIHELQGTNGALIRRVKQLERQVKK